MLLFLHIEAVFRISRPEVFCKKGVLKNFTGKFTGKHVRQKLFITQGAHMLFKYIATEEVTG